MTYTINLNRKLVKTINFYNDGTFEEIPMAHMPAGIHFNPPNPSNWPANASYTLSANSQYNSLMEYIKDWPTANGITVNLSNNTLVGPADC